MKKLCCLLLILILGCASAWAEDGQTLTIGGFSEMSEGYQMLKAAHPDASVRCVPLLAYSTDELVSALLTGNFEHDLFSLSTGAFRIRDLAEKGYCADLSGNAGVMALVQRMHPAIREEITWNGQVYALPYACTMDYLTYDPAAWQAAGLRADDVPRDFASLLDFLERWIVRAEAGETPEYAVFSDWDEGQYNPSSYAARLVELLMKQHMMQQSYAHAPLVFSGGDFQALAERCVALGYRLYEIERTPNARPALLHVARVTSMVELPYRIPLRLNEAQPALISMSLQVMIVHSDSDAKELATAFAVYQAQHHADGMGAAFLLADAAAVENPRYAQENAFWQRQMDETKARLADAQAISPEERGVLEAQLARQEAALKSASAPANRYLISAEELSVYRQNSGNFYFQPPSVFDPATQDGQMAKQLCARYASGTISVEQLIKRLDEMAWMIEMERNE